MSPIKENNASQNTSHRLESQSAVLSNKMPGGAKQANALKSTLWDITVTTDVPTHLKNPCAILKECVRQTRSKLADKLNFQ